MSGGADLLGTALYAGAFGLTLLGLYTAVARRHLVRVLLGIGLLEAGVNLFIVAAGFRHDAAAPILTGGEPVGPMVDPIPQALILTSIVIGVGVLALGLALAVRLQEHLGTLDLRALAERVAATDAAPGPPEAPR